MILESLNEPKARLVIGLIIGSAIGSPYFNGYSESLGWVVVGALFFALVITTVVGKYEFDSDNVWILFLVGILFAAFCAFLYFMAGNF